LDHAHDALDALLKTGQTANAEIRAAISALKRLSELSASSGERRTKAEARGIAVARLQLGILDLLEDRQ